MNAWIKYNLDDEDDRMAHLRAVKSLDLALALWDIDQWLRGQVKYHDKYEAVRVVLHEIMNGYSIDLDELIQ